ncbi:CRISPR type I-E/ECOLI-associated protein CasB/Cse2 [Corynebacterium mustelae]|uniref:CRISPR type I-E/ECOLI-associated protein CasB/Cse2 n=1 Tax=Corynebacterium mustelae TaxID=571915 RepID=A0A0G3H6P8_9CORY|nr:type I-E CRISPR-associated protein Cse2/CasB [Corynebacterium mustelae]AKK06787.1 CRISPR type I-E/ECOLI-associated protein CasB/Cse2 [Corynebacterium mustelae]
MAASKTAQIRAVTTRIISQLQDGYLAGTPNAKANIAAFRRQANRHLGESPETWAVFSESLPADLVGKGENPSPAEKAIFTALTLYAVHQQSKTEPMHVPSQPPESGTFTAENGLGTAVRKMATITDTELFDSSLYRRFVSIVQSQTFEATVHHLRSMIQLLRTESIPLDYGLLAKDLYRFQFPDSKKSVQLSWARQLYRTESPTE